MELKVWVEGIQRIVCGVTVNTTCQDVVFALAHATGKVGRFTLIERWRNNERHLAPNENPLKLLLKWGEYANDVQFILQRSESKQQQPQQGQHASQTNQVANSNNGNALMMMTTTTGAATAATTSPVVNNTTTTVLKKPLGLSNSNNNNNNKNNNNSNSNIKLNGNHKTIDGVIPNALQKQKSSIELSSYKSKELKKSFGAYDAKHIENIGIVKGIPQQQPLQQQQQYQQQQQQQQQQHPIVQQQQQTLLNTGNHNQITNMPQFMMLPKHEKSHSNPIEMTNAQTTTPATPTTNNVYNDYYNFNNNNNNSNNNNNNNANNNNHLYSQIGPKQHQQQQQQQQQHTKSINEINLAEVRNALDRRTSANNSPNDIYNNNNNNNNSPNNHTLLLNNNHHHHQQQQQPQQQQHANNNNNMSHENLMEIYANTTCNTTSSSSGSGSNSTNNTPYNASPDLYKQTPTISANGALVPPPYRDPPPPRNSPMQRLMNAAETISNSSSSASASAPMSATILQQNANMLINNGDYNSNNNSNNMNNNNNNEYDYEFKQFGVIGQHINANGMMGAGSNIGGGGGGGVSAMDEGGESIFQATQYNDLMQLIKFQREKINAQQMELNKFDAEIVFLETKERDQAQELEAISREITKADQIFRQGSEQLQTLQYVEEENELVKQQEKTLKSEITLLRSKLTNCETELLQCKNKIRQLMDDIEIEQRTITQKQKNNNRQNVERDFLMEMERIQSEIDQALHSADTSNKATDNLKKELVMIENAIAEKKRQVEQLVNEMKEVNLQSLTVTTSEEIKHLLEGPNKQGSSRRIIGSPRQLENAVPTSKNPHGVWV